MLHFTTLPSLHPLIPLLLYPSSSSLPTFLPTVLPFIQRSVHASFCCSAALILCHYAHLQLPLSVPQSLISSFEAFYLSFVHLLIWTSILPFILSCISPFFLLLSNRFFLSPCLGFSVLPFLHPIVRPSLHLTFFPSQ